MLNTLELAQDDEDCLCVNPKYLEDNNFLPNLFIQYRYNEFSDFSFRLNTSYYNNKINKSSYNQNPIKLNEDDIAHNLTDDQEISIEHIDIDFTTHYNILGFKNVDIFAGIKTRFGKMNFNSIRKYQINEFELLHSETVAYEDTNLKLAYLFGVSYLGQISNLNYDVSFSFQSNLSNYTFENQSPIEYKLNTYGLSFNLYYDIIK